LKPILSDFPFQIIGIDTVEFERDNFGYRYAIIVVDYYSKFSIAVKLKKMDGKTIRRKLMDRVFSTYGIHTLKEIFKKLEFERKQEWTSVLQEALGAYNYSQHTSINCSPYFELFQRIPKIENSKDLVKEELIKSKKDQKLQLDKASTPADYRIGEIVYMKNPYKKKKFDRDFVGPYKIISMDPKENYTLNTPNPTKVNSRLIKRTP